MRTDKDIQEHNVDDSTAVAERKRSNKIILFLSILPFISVLTIILSGLVNKADVLDMMKVGALTFLLTTALGFFARMNDYIFEKKFSTGIILISYIISIILIMLQKSPEIYSFWMIGALLISMLLDNKLGLIVYFNLAFILSITAYLNLETTVHLLIMGVLFALLSGSLRSKSTVIYAAVIILSSNITLSFILNNFIFENSSNFNYLASFFSILAVLVTAFLLSCIYDRLVKANTISNEAFVTNKVNDVVSNCSVGVVDSTVNSDNINTSDNNEADSYKPAFDRSIRSSYDVLLSDNNELLMKMKEHSEALYKHSITIGDLSGRAAGIIGADTELARAGGYYHEIGKIMGKNYIEEGLKIADEYAFPEDLKSILKQHSIKHDKPTFVEAAIVMLSDNVASTIEYIEKTGEGKFTNDKIIDNIFKMRMDKGTFDDAGLSVKDFKLLKEFFQDEYKSKQ